ncbi:MAG: YitT family protein [Sphaerochaetaceae bacterium]|nr:YitT family protein [Sphaerochaetaceae bacterium]
MRRKIVEYLNLSIGSFLVAVSVAFLVNPAKIASGGVSGIATIFYHTVGWNPGYVIFVLSIPLFLVGMKIFGKVYGFKSLVGTVLLSVFTTILVDLTGGVGILDYSDSISMLLSAVFGGVIMGAGIGFVMKGGANTGGTDIVAQILNKYTPLSLGTCLTLVDGVIIAISAFVFGIESAMYAIITVYICGITIDKVALPIGANTAKTVFIISEHVEEIKKVILDELDHGATLLSATGMYTGYDRPVIMTVISNQELSTLTGRVKDIDERAFMIVQDAHQVLGEGFMPISKAMNMKFGN